jgi:hypothetical protein
MKYYKFRQNNSRGYYTDPAVSVIVLAKNSDDANHQVLQHGVYFDGVSCGSDCCCCGDRWYKTDDWGILDEDEITDIKDSLTYELGDPTEWGDGIPDVLLIENNQSRLITLKTVS